MRVTHLMIGVCLLLLALALPGMAQDKPTAPTTEEIDAVRTQGRYLATITLEKGGVIEVVLEGKEAPLTVANYVKLANAKYYDGITFHRVEPGFVIQGGDPKGNGTGGPGYGIQLEIAATIKHKKGAISMARASDPNSAGSQFFITLADTPFLDKNYAVFGWVKSGMDVVEGVKKGDKMKTVTVAPYTGKEDCPLVGEYAASKFQPPTEKEIDAVRTQGRYLTTITLEKGGVIEVVLEGKEAPLTVANYVKLANAKYYDGITFHRVEPGFVIQGGDPAGNGTGGPGYTIKLEIAKNLRHLKGFISMARTSDPDSAGSQFFITLAPTPFLDGKYAVFGWVKNGMDVVEGVKKGDKMKTVTIVPYAGKEACPIEKK